MYLGPSRKSRLLHPPKLSHCVPSSGLFLIYIAKFIASFDMASYY